ncbi:uncharacterized protein KY384_008664 [Bacidia gigantensis]|uniref:uncharacterized protein n=1 Tax=Bacidia gigantensis TaxID=2732470 RepID=UPI001D04EB75|nr:uncharacterized protein KY384_008659 [Bacidia gigantensis]XP_044666517.1 uncharacterized protein KY384_008664 [Bacidia gigantensis]KAG8527229.1 hypothetical protein KY384_008659 [Bacidia gigantensis]KAG8527234.1 hypothetical protein KY384_008664 [Bacidia gigantensis]
MMIQLNVHTGIYKKLHNDHWTFNIPGLGFYYDKIKNRKNNLKSQNLEIKDDAMWKLALLLTSFAASTQITSALPTTQNGGRAVLQSVSVINARDAKSDAADPAANLSMTIPASSITPRTLKINVNLPRYRRRIEPAAISGLLQIFQEQLENKGDGPMRNTEITRTMYPRLQVDLQPVQYLGAQTISYDEAAGCVGLVKAQVEAEHVVTDFEFTIKDEDLLLAEGTLESVGDGFAKVEGLEVSTSSMGVASM